jgi:hypothetical protein
MLPPLTSVKKKEYHFRYQIKGPVPGTKLGHYGKEYCTVGTVQDLDLAMYSYG